MPFDASTSDKRDFARQAAAKSSSLVSRDPAAAGRRSWARRSAEQKAAQFAVMRAALDPHQGGRAMAELCKDPQFLLEREISRLRAEAIERGEIPPLYYRVELCEEPTRIKHPGRMRRKRAERGTR
jgi:hypothetical protein